MLPTPTSLKMVEGLMLQVPGLQVSDRARAALEVEERRRVVAASYHGGQSQPMPDSQDLDPHQVVGVQFLVWAQRCILADSPGLGKTIQSIRASEIVSLEGRKLVIAPKSLLLQWRLEIQRFAGRPFAQILGMRDDPDPEATWVLTNYEVVVRRVEELSKAKFQILIVDEASRIKGRKTGRTKAVSSLARTVPVCYLLTATPIRNYPEELWSLLHCIDPKRYPSFWSWVGQFMETENNGYGIQLVGLRQDRLDDFHAELLPRLLQRDKDLLNLPKLTLETVPLAMDPADEKAYRQMESKFFAVMPDGRLLGAPNVLSQLTRLRQITLGAKLRWISEWLGDNLRDHKAVVFFPFKEPVYKLADLASTYRPALVTGDQTPDEREAAKDRFNTDPECRLFIGTDACAGEGLNLKFQADTVIFGGKSWTPDMVEQCIGRVYRRGQSLPVHVLSPCVMYSVDSDMEEVLTSKAVASTEALAIRAVAQKVLLRIAEGGESVEHSAD